MVSKISRTWWTWLAQFSYPAIGLLILSSGCSTAPSVSFPTYSQSQSVSVSAALYRPEGNGPFPAIVLLHMCEGVSAHDFDYASRLRAEGFVVAIPDSFSSRGIGIERQHCTVSSFPSDVRNSLIDGMGTAAYLNSLPFVIKNRIALVGFSMGANATLNLPPQSASLGIRAAVSFYPACAPPLVPLFFQPEKIPLLLLLAELDEYGSASVCENRTQQMRRKGQNVEWEIYPGAHHGFDNPEWSNPKRPRIWGYKTLMYQEAAATASWKRFLAFVNQHLRTEP